MDGTWLYDKYKATLLMVVAQDENNNIFPIAFVLVESEMSGGWSFFLNNLRLHIAPQTNLCLISDRHSSIESAYNNPENGWQDPRSTHVYCIRHIAQNFMRQIKDKTLRKKVVNAGYALTELSFHYYHEEIRLTNVDVVRWIDNIPVEKWTKAFDNGQQRGHMTTNLVESMNSVIKGIRNLLITTMVRATYFSLGSLFKTRGSKWRSVLQSGQLFSEISMKSIQQETAKANTHVVTMFDRIKVWFSVAKTMDHNEGRPRGYNRFELDRTWCDCGKFQAFRMPCSYVIAACAHARMDPSKYISLVYHVKNVLNVYNKCFTVVAQEDYWPSY